jgi:hypothetical protein
LEDSIRCIADRATEAFGAQALRLGVPHVFIVTAFLRGDSYVVTVSNTDDPHFDTITTLRSYFSVQPIRVLHPLAVYGGAGVAAMSHSDRDLLDRVRLRTPRRRRDFLGLLAAVSRRAVRSRTWESGTISSGCVAGHIRPPEQPEALVEVFAGDGIAERIGTPPFVAYGIDTTEMARAMVHYAPTTGERLGLSDFDDALRRSVEPE